MKIQSLLLLESYATAQRIFISQGGDPETVQKALDVFKRMNQRQILKQEERDITKWIRDGWDKFLAFIHQTAARQSNKTAKKASKSDSIRVAEDDEWLVVIPLSASASCFYGANTQWCTAGSVDNRFDEYFADGETTLFYIINKKTSQKMAVAYHYNDAYECFDANDKSITMDKIAEETGFDLSHFQDWRKKFAPDTRKARMKIGGEKLMDEARERARDVVNTITQRYQFLSRDAQQVIPVLRRHISGERVLNRETLADFTEPLEQASDGLYSLIRSIRWRLSPSDEDDQTLAMAMKELMAETGIFEKIEKFYAECQRYLDDVKS